MSGGGAPVGGLSSVALGELDELAERKRAAVPERVIAPLRERWSPRAFAERTVSDADLRALLEAARWAASSGNQQPWRFLVVRREDEAGFETALSCLREGNVAWARSAPVLLFTFAQRSYERKNGESRTNRTAQHDLGLAVGNLSAQATAMGLALHQMGGVLLERIREVYAVPDEVDPVTAIALGYRGEPDGLAEDLRARERAERSRRPLAELVFEGAFGRSADLADDDA